MLFNVKMCDPAAIEVVLCIVQGLWLAFLILQVEGSKRETILNAKGSIYRYLEPPEVVAVGANSRFLDSKTIKSYHKISN